MKAVLMTVFVLGTVYGFARNDLGFQPQKEIARQDKSVSTLQEQAKAMEVHRQAVELEVTKVKERAEELARLEAERKAREEAELARIEAEKKRRWWHALKFW